MTVTDLSTSELDLLVASLEGKDWLRTDDASGKVMDWRDFPPRPYRPTADWADGGPIIQREDIVVVPFVGFYRATKVAVMLNAIVCQAEGRNYLEAAMRCFVASRLGEDLKCPI